MQLVKSVGKISVVAMPLRHQALNGLRQAIIDGKLGPGARLRELELSSVVGVSRTVIREVLRQLEAEGLVTTVPNKGAIVRTLPPREAEDIYRIRALLEGFAARLFVENAPAALLERLLAAGRGVITAYDTGNVNSILKAKDRFYDALFEGTGSKVLSSILRSLNAQISRWRTLCLWYPDNGKRKAEKSVRDIKAMLTAIEQRDAEAAERITREHVMNAAKAVMHMLREQKSADATRTVHLGEQHRTAHR
jgi:DNA-binding GntR family transcriptional regulator